MIKKHCRSVGCSNKTDCEFCDECRASINAYYETRKRLFARVKALMKWNDKKIEHWFKRENPNLGGVSPDHMIALGRAHKLEKFVASAEYENSR